MNNTADLVDDMKPEYELDYSQGVRGKYYEQAMRAKSLVQLDADLLRVFPTAADVNAALRSVLEASKHVRLAA